MICAVQVISVELDIGRSEKQHKEKEASHKFYVARGNITLQRPRKSKQAYVKEYKYVPTGT